MSGMDAFGRTTTGGSAMCSLCRFAAHVETDVDRPEVVATAFAFAVHFATQHPEVRGGVSRYVIMVPESEAVSR